MLAVILTLALKRAFWLQRLKLTQTPPVNRSGESKLASNSGCPSRVGGQDRRCSPLIY